MVYRFNYTVGDVIDGRYTIEQRLGEGTYGVVFKVTDEVEKTTRALKVLKLWEVPDVDREYLNKRFEREYETGRINSEYLVHSVGKGEVYGNPYIVMEFCPGGDLEHAYSRSRMNLPRLANQVLLGLHALHTNGKVHRDLKPANVLIRANGNAALTDFGIIGDQNNRTTQRGLMGAPKERFGTWMYMPPEQVTPRRGNATVLPTTDIFSFGVMMYEIIVGQLPFGELNTPADLPTYTANGKKGRWDRDKLRRSHPDGELWLPLIEACLTPDYTARVQTVVEVIAMLPKDRSIVVPEKPMTFSNGATNELVLRIMQGEEIGRLYHLNRLVQGQNGVVTMGRRNDEVTNKLDIAETESSYISRRHCTFEWYGASFQCRLRDGQWVSSEKKWYPSLNGTYLNSRQVDENGLWLTDGDIITIGDVKMRVEFGRITNSGI